MTSNISPEIRLSVDTSLKRRRKALVEDKTRCISIPNRFTGGVSGTS